MNKVMLIGNVGQEPQVKYLDQGVCVAQISLATTEKGYTLQNGTQVPDRTEWHNCIFWRKQAEIVEKFVHKGDKLYVEGKIQSRNWTDKRGITHKTVDINAENFEFLTPKQTAQGVAATAFAQTAQTGVAAMTAQSQQQQQSQPQTVQPSTPAAVSPAENDGEYPF